jgi:hypothetical protein
LAASFRCWTYLRAPRAVNDPGGCRLSSDATKIAPVAGVLHRLHEPPDWVFFSGGGMMQLDSLFSQFAGVISGFALWRIGRRTKVAEGKA